MAEVSALEQMLSVKEGAAVCWVGNAGWLVYAGGRLIAFDLELKPGWMRAEDPAVSVEEIAPKLNVHFLSHEHEDHFNTYTCQVLVERSECLFVVPANNVEKAGKIGIPEARTRVARPRQPFDLDGIRVEPLRALHGHRGFAVHDEASMEDCGYVVTMGGKTFLHPGDSVLLTDHLKLEGVNVLFVSPTEHNTHVARSVTLINALEPDYIFPQHHGTYPETEQNRHWTHGYPDELKAALPKPMQERFHKVEQGAVFVIE